MMCLFCGWQGCRGVVDHLREVKAAERTEWTEASQRPMRWRDADGTPEYPISRSLARAAVKFEEYFTGKEAVKVSGEKP